MTTVAILVASGTALIMLVAIRSVYYLGVSQGVSFILTQLDAQDEDEPLEEEEQPLPVYGNGTRSTSTARRPQ